MTALDTRPRSQRTPPPSAPAPGHARHTAALAAGLLLLVALAASLDAQAPQSPLDAVAEEALRNNLELGQERLAARRAAAGVREARGRLLPSITLDSRYSEQRGTLDLGDFVNPAYAALNEIIGEPRFPTDLSLTLPLTHESRLRLVQPLFEPAAIAAHSLAGHARDARDLERRAVARRIAAQAQTALLDAAAARSARGIWEATLDLVVESERVAQRLVEAGRATPDAVFRARAERSDVEQRLAEARETADAAERAFNRILRRPLDTPVDPLLESLSDSLLRVRLSLTEEDAVARALARREELAQADAGARAADAGVRLASSAFLPSVAVAVDYGFQGSELSFRRDEDFTVASVVLSWNVLAGGKDLARRQAALADAERTRLRRAEVEDLVRLDVQQAYAAALTTRDAIATANARLAAARRTFDLVRRRYEEGLATQVEFLDARTALTGAEMNRVLTVYRYAARRVDLERAAALRDID